MQTIFKPYVYMVSMASKLMYVYTDVKLCVRKTFLKNKILGIKICVILRTLVKE